MAHGVLSWYYYYTTVMSPMPLTRCPRVLLLVGVTANHVMALCEPAVIDNDEISRSIDSFH